MIPDDEQLQTGRQTAVVVKALREEDRSREDPLSEIVSLADTAGLEVVGRCHQRLARPHPGTYFGKGKVHEAAHLAAEIDADFIIADNDLTPAQERNLEKITGRTVLDRSEVIMDIFAQHAKTRQAKLQVELAQLRYSLPRLKRLWTHLSRYEGGIGMRGPGETQLETDKRLIARRIQKLVRQLKEIERQKESALLRRQNEFVVALVGYTNAGKSTLLNALTASSELVEDKLFATLDTRVRRWSLTPSRYVLLTDTVGFIRDLPHHLVASFHATLAETTRADLLFHVVDASARDAPWQIRTVQRVLKQLEIGGRPTWLLLNKWDAVPPERLIEARHLPFVEDRDRGDADRRLPASGGSAPPCFLISGRSGEGLEELGRGLLEDLERRDLSLELAVPHRRGDVLSYLRENARIDAAEYLADAVRVRLRISPAREARLRHLFPEGFPAPARVDADGLHGSPPGDGEP
ncbi:MAG: GTPase HflX [Planctomycetes bacterium]|nr:GTPase HflX [Planctomycetota bacterium]